MTLFLCYFLLKFSKFFIFYCFHWNRFTTCILHHSAYALNIKPTKFYNFQKCITIRAAEMVLRPQAKKSNRYNQKASSKKIKEIFKKHFFFQKKVTHSRREPLGICIQKNNAKYIGNFSAILNHIVVLYVYRKYSI